MLSTNKQIELFVASIESYGYCVDATPIPGHEEQFRDSIKQAFACILATTVLIESKYKTRGRSRRALSILHTMLPEPAWGIEVK